MNGVPPIGGRQAEEVKARFLKRYGVTSAECPELFENSQLHFVPARGEVDLGQFALHIVIEGCVAVGRGEISRLWGRRAVLGDPKCAFGYANGQMDKATCLTDVVTLAIGRRQLTDPVFANPVAAKALLAMIVERQEVLERVYASSRRKPEARVAELLYYLVEAVGRPVARGARADMRLGDHLPFGYKYPVEIVGPTQVRMADALMLGHATVEKALQKFRKNGLLAANHNGARTNRVYRVLDPAALRQARL